MDPVTAAVDGLWTTAVLAFLFLLPGLTLGPTIAPGAMSPGTRLGRAVAVSLLATSATSAVLATAHLLRPTILGAALIGLTILPLHARLPNRPRFPDARRRWWWLGALILFGIVLVVLVLPAWLGPLARGSLPAPSWEHVASAEATARDGGFPRDIAAWGDLRPFTADHPLPTAHLAAAILLLPGDVLAGTAVYRVALVGALTVVATMLFRRWLSSGIAALGALLLLGSVAMRDDLRSGDPGAWAVGIALFGLWLVDRVMNERSRRLAVGAAAVGAATLLSHPAVFLAWLAGVAGLAVARVLVDPVANPAASWAGQPRSGTGLVRRLGLRGSFGRRSLLPLAWAASIVIAGLFVGLAADVLLTGKPGVVGYLTGRPAAEPADVLIRIAELPPDWQFSDDPTWDLARAAYGVGGGGDAKAPTMVDRDLVAAAVLVPWPRIDGRTAGGAVLLFGLAAVAALGWRVGDERRRRFILVGVVLAVAIALGGLAVLAAADGYAGRAMVARRLLPFTVALPVVAAALGLWLLGGRLLRNWRAGAPSRAAPPSAMAVLVVIAVLVAAPPAATDTSPLGDARPHDPSAMALEAYAWMAANLPDDARVLVAAYTPGTVAVLARRTGIVDGPAYAPDDPGWPARDTARLLAARRLFLEPDGPGAAAFTEREAVDYLLIPGPNGSASDLGGYAPFPVDLPAFEASDWYATVHEFGDGRLLLLETTGG